MLRMNHVAGMLVLVGAIVAGCSSNHLPTPPPKKSRARQQTNVHRRSWIYQGVKGLSPLFPSPLLGLFGLLSFRPQRGELCWGKTRNETHDSECGRHRRVRNDRSKRRPIGFSL